MRSVRHWPVAVLVGMLSMVMSTNAQATGTWSFGASAGGAIPMGNFGDVFSSGFDASANADYGLSEAFAIGFNVGGNLHNATDEFDAALNNLTAGLLILGGATGVSSNLETKANVLRFGVHGKWTPPTANVKPFIQGGLGLYRITTKLEGSITANGFTIASDESASETKSGLQLGAGVLFPTGSSVSLGVGAQFHNVFTENESSQYFSVAGIVAFGSSGSS